MTKREHRFYPWEGPHLDLERMHPKPGEVFEATEHASNHWKTATQLRQAREDASTLPVACRCSLCLKREEENRT